MALSVEETRAKLTSRFAYNKTSSLHLKIETAAEEWCPAADQSKYRRPISLGSGHGKLFTV